MMLTPDQIRLRLEAAGRAYVNDDTDSAVNMILGVLHELLPDLVALASGRTADDAGRRYRATKPAPSPVDIRPMTPAELDEAYRRACEL